MEAEQVDVVRRVADEKLVPVGTVGERRDARRRLVQVGRSELSQQSRGMVH